MAQRQCQASSARPLKTENRSTAQAAKRHSKHQRTHSIPPSPLLLRPKHHNRLFIATPQPHHLHIVTTKPLVVMRRPILPYKLDLITTGGNISNRSWPELAEIRGTPYLIAPLKTRRLLTCGAKAGLGIWGPAP